MTVYKPKKSPYYHYDFVFRGERHTASTGCTLKRDALEFERRQRVEAALPTKRRPPLTVDEACGLYQEHAETLSSWKTTEYMLDAMIKGLGANRLLSDVSQRDLQLYFAKRRVGRKDSTINREVDNARAVWKRADRTRYDVGEMPDWRALKLKVTERPPRELSAEHEEEKLFAAMPDDAVDVVQFTLESGWRRQEVIGLRWQDCDLHNAVAQTRIKGGNVVMRPLSRSLVAIISRQPKSGPFVFTYVCQKSRGGRRKGERYPMTATALKLRFNQARKAGGIQNFRFHDLRHTAATRILRATQNLAVTKEVLKHSNIKTTLRYAHVLEDDVRNALEAVKSRNTHEPVKRESTKPKQSQRVR